MMFWNNVKGFAAQPCIGKKESKAGWGWWAGWGRDKLMCFSFSQTLSPSREVTCLFEFCSTKLILSFAKYCAELEFWSVMDTLTGKKGKFEPAALHFMSCQNTINRQLWRYACWSLARWSGALLDVDYSAHTRHPALGICTAPGLLRVIWVINK